jgi:hypothetical protein
VYVLSVFTYFRPYTSGLCLEALKNHENPVILSCVHADIRNGRFYYSRQDLPFGPSRLVEEKVADFKRIEHSMQGLLRRVICC